MESSHQFTYPVITLKPEDSIYDSLLLMSQMQIRQIVISLNQVPIGIVTDRNIVKFLKNDKTKRRLDTIPLSEVKKKFVIIFADRKDFFSRCSIQMNLFGTSSVIVVDDHRQLRGIITKSDIVKNFSEIYRGSGKVKDYMTNPVVTCKKEDKLEHALQLLDEYNIGRLVIIDKDEKPVGIITYSTILRKTNLFEPLGKINMHVAVLLEDCILVKDLMVEDLFTVNAEDEIVKAAEIIVKYDISGLPVIDESGKLSGMISSSDIVRIYEKEFNDKQ